MPFSSQWKSPMHGSLVPIKHSSPGNPEGMHLFGVDGLIRHWRPDAQSDVTDAPHDSPDCFGFNGTHTFLPVTSQTPSAQSKIVVHASPSFTNGLQVPPLQLVPSGHDAVVHASPTATGFLQMPASQ